MFVVLDSWTIILTIELINLATFLKFNNLPLNVDEAKADGWTESDSCKGMRELVFEFFLERLHQESRSLLRERGGFFTFGIYCWIIFLNFTALTEDF